MTHALQYQYGFSSNEVLRISECNVRCYQCFYQSAGGATAGEGSKIGNKSVELRQIQANVRDLRERCAHLSSDNNNIVLDGGSRGLSKKNSSARKEEKNGIGEFDHCGRLSPGDEAGVNWGTVIYIRVNSSNKRGRNLGSKQPDQMDAEYVPELESECCVEGVPETLVLIRRLNSI